VPSLATRQNAPAALKPYLNVFPLPNGPEQILDGRPTGLAQSNAGFSTWNNLDATNLRIDRPHGGQRFPREL